MLGGDLVEAAKVGTFSQGGSRNYRMGGWKKDGMAGLSVVGCGGSAVHGFETHGGCQMQQGER